MENFMVGYINNIVEKYAGLLISHVTPAKGSNIAVDLPTQIEDLETLSNKVKLGLGALAAVALILTVIFASSIAGAAWLIPALILALSITALTFAFIGHRRAIDRLEGKQPSQKTSAPPENPPACKPVVVRPRCPNPFKYLPK
jgi:hypothetical protein